MSLFNKMCVCCMGKSGSKSLFKGPKRGFDANVTYSKMIEVCCNFTINEDDKLPKLICNKCMSQLRLAYKFVTKCEKSFRKIKETVTELIECKYEPTVEIKKDDLDMLETREDGNSHDTEESGIYEAEIKVEEPDNNDDDDEEDGMSIYDLVKNSIAAGEQSRVAPFKRKQEKEISIVSEKKPEEVDLKPFLTAKSKTVCQICLKYCHTASKLRDHVSYAHLGIKPYYCEICKKEYSSEQRHKQKHSPSVPFNKKCEYCEEIFESKYNYFFHIKEHGKNLTCECGMAFKNPSSFYRHRKKHKGKRMMCHLCSKAFLRKDNLNDHIRRHNNETSHPCDQCSKSFLNAYDLKLHKERHLDKKTFSCEGCDILFRTRKDLYQHRWRHHKTEKKYSCKFCGKAFRRSDHRNVHQRTVHSLEEIRDLREPSSFSIN